MSAENGEIIQLIRDRFTDLNHRMDDQDITLERLERKVDRTNGRVTDIEQERAAERAVEAALASRGGRRTALVKWWVGLAAMFGSAVVGGLAGEIGHAAGIW